MLISTTLLNLKYGPPRTIKDIVDDRVPAMVFSWNTRRSKAEYKPICGWYSMRISTYNSFYKEGNLDPILECSSSQLVHTPQGQTFALSPINYLLDEEQNIITIQHKITDNNIPIDTFGYTIMVEDNHNFFANGILVECYDKRWEEQVLKCEDKK